MLRDCLREFAYWGKKLLLILSPNSLLALDRTKATPIILQATSFANISDRKSGLEEKSYSVSPSANMWTTSTYVALKVAGFCLFVFLDTVI